LVLIHSEWNHNRRDHFTLSMMVDSGSESESDGNEPLVVKVVQTARREKDNTSSEDEEEDEEEEAEEMGHKEEAPTAGDTNRKRPAKEKGAALANKKRPSNPRSHGPMQ
jgi:hypothetical protein